MVRVGIVDLSKSNLCDFDINKIQQGAERERIEKTKNKEQRERRIAAYLLLERMLKDVLLDGEMPRIIYTPRGKPCFDDVCGVNLNCHFNISHNGDVAVVAVSDAEVGVDVQLQNASEDSKSRVAARFADALFSLDGRDESNLCVDFSFFVIKDGEVSERDNAKIANFTKSETAENFFARWTLLESALKLDGGGFASIGNISAIVERASFKTVSFEIQDEKYALTVAQSK